MRASVPNVSQPTLLVFTLGDQRETARRRLLPARWGSDERRLHRTCLDNALDAGRTAGLRLEVSSPTEIDLPVGTTFRQQQGRGFGPRLRRALEESFHASDGPVLVVGTDAPGLDADHIQGALGALQQDPDAVVVGPSTDGGFYLLAACRPLDEALADVRWCCRHTLDHLLRALGRLGRRVILLPTLQDLDQRQDLEQWLAQIGPKDGRPRRADIWFSLRRDLAAALRLLRAPNERPRITLLRQHFLSTALLRGPPRTLSAIL